MTKTVARCSIYSNRPEVCRAYPTVYSYTPPECTYYFAGSRRQGECLCNTGACCSIPREGGEPGGAPLAYESGGSPCKHLVYEEAEVEETGEKIACSLSREEYNLLGRE